ncbi:MAG: flagellar filament capping protein FliD [Pontiellaceae bacterium]|nr:flagellar filament capping protein FliD [Pontiellaceae bacterium]
MALHVSGLSSGNDYQSMIDQLMAVKRVPIDSLSSKQSEIDYDLGAWNDISTYASALTYSLDDLRGYDLWDKMSVDSTNSSAATASAAPGSAEQRYAVIVSKLAAAQSISSDWVDTSTDLVTQGKAVVGDVFTIEGQEITIEDGETLVTLRTKINNAAASMDEDVRVRASIVNDHLVLTREKSGVGSINLSDTTGTVLQNLGVLDATAVIKNENVAGQDAEFSVNGISVTRSDNNGLTDVVEGMTINLKGVGVTTLDVHPDREAAKEAILAFVENYNMLAGYVTDAGKIDLGSSSDLAQKGELYGDSLVNSMRLALRDQISSVKSGGLTELNATYTYNGQDGIMDSLSDIGVWTSGQKNQLEVVDETRLDDMLDNEFENVAQLFRGTFDDVEVAYTNGVASDFYSYMNKLSESMTGDIAVRMQTLTDKYDDLGDEIADLERGLGDYEQKLWDEFTGMEDALTKMNSQLDYIKSIFFQDKSD